MVVFGVGGKGSRRGGGWTGACRLRRPHGTSGVQACGAGGSCGRNRRSAGGSVPLHDPLSEWCTHPCLVHGAPLHPIPLLSRLTPTPVAPPAAFHPPVAQVLVYSTVMGAIGVVYPFTSREDVDFFSHLEMHLRQENPPLAGRDHLAYRWDWGLRGVCVLWGREEAGDVTDRA